VDGQKKSLVFVKERLCLRNAAKNAFWEQKNRFLFAKKIHALFPEKEFMPLMSELANIRVKQERESTRMLLPDLKKC